MKYTPGQGVTLFKEPTNRANGLTRDIQGRLVACEHDTRRVTRQELDGSITVIANSFQGRRLNRPNDVVVKSDGSIYFTDPNGNFVPEQWDLSFPGVYRVTPDLGTLTLLSDNFVGPNGLAFSPDESVLYVIDARRRQIRAFDMLPNGTLSKQTERLFADLGGSEPGNPDGMKVDTAGNVFLAVRAESTFSTRRARNSAASSTAIPPRPISASAAPTGNPLLYQPEPAGRGQREDSWHPSAGAGKEAGLNNLRMIGGFP